MPAGTNIIGKVSLAGLINGAVSIADSTLAVTQSGTWNVNTSAVGRVSVFVDQVPFNVSVNNSLPILVSVNGFAKVHVSNVLPDHGVTQSGTWTIQPGNTPNTTPWLVSVNNNIAVSVQAGRVSINQIVSVTPNHAIGSAIGANAVSSGKFYWEITVGGTDGTSLRAMLVDALGALKTSGFVTNAENSFTRPTDVVAYTVGDLVANTTVVGTVTPLTWSLSRYSTGGGTVMVRRARIVCSDPRTAGDRNYRLHLFNTSNGITNDGVSVAGGDNTAFQPTKCSAYLGYISVAVAMSCGEGAVGWGSTQKGMEMNIVLPTNQFSIQGLLEARTSILPASGARFNVTLEAYQD